MILYLIGTTAFGSVGFISPGYEGSMSYRELFKNCGLQDFLEEGDLLLVDRGCVVRPLLMKFHQLRSVN